MARAVVAACDVRAGESVLDVAAGTGNAALAAAQRGARVTALDLTAALIERGRRRTADAGFDVRWVQGDAIELPFATDAFDATVSILGVMFATEPARAAAELARVTAPGGRVAVASWTRDGLSGALSACVGRHMTRPPGFVDPHDWGEPERLGEWLGPHVDGIRCERRSVTWRFPSAAAAVKLLERDAGAFVAARAHVGEERWSAVREDLLALLTERAHVTSAGIELEWAYLLAIAPIRERVS